MTKRDIRKSGEEVKLRTLQINISDNDLKTLAEICGRNEITVQELFETFVGDLTGGVFYSGSDEGDLADQWLNRHCFSWDDSKSLLKWLCEYGGGVSQAQDIITAWNEKTLYESDPEKYLEDMDETEDTLSKWWDDDISEIESEGVAVNAEEIRKVSEWLQEYEKLSDQ